jgi:hypothetical protein
MIKHTICELSSSFSIFGVLCTQRMSLLLKYGFAIIDAIASRISVHNRKWALKTVKMTSLKQMRQ